MCTVAPLKRRELEGRLRGLAEEERLMRLAGRVWKEGRHWLAEVPMLDALTQGHTRAEALRMLVDLVVTMADRAGFSVKAFPGAGEELEIGTPDSAALVAVMLRRQREKHGLSLSEVARLLGASSKTAYARYEQGRSVPSVEKLFELLRAVAPKQDFVLRECPPRPRPAA
jgi:DNA-binding XRE family transcriptional regulator